MIEIRVSVTLGGPATLWKQRFGQIDGGIVNGISQNQFWSRVNDGIDPLGHETYSYTDGFGRVIQGRTEAENGQFRVSDEFYDLRGATLYETIGRLEPGSNYVKPDGELLGSNRPMVS